MKEMQFLSVVYIICFVKEKLFFQRIHFTCTGMFKSFKLSKQIMWELPLAKCLISKSDQIGICFFKWEGIWGNREKKLETTLK